MSDRPAGLSERASIERAVSEARMPDGRPRFYPPGQHPATYRARWMRDKLLGLVVEHPTAWTAKVQAALDFYEQQIRAVEAGEARNLQRFVEWVRRAF